MVKALVVVIPAVVAIYCLVQVAQSRADQVRTLPRWGWMIAILALPLVGAAGWLYAGRPRKPRNPRPKRPTIVPPDDDPDFLRGIRFRKPTDRPDDPA